MNIVVFVVYVDDLLMFGGRQSEPVLSKVGREIKMDDPEEIGKYLGCNHEFVTVGPTTTIVWEMRDYLISAVDEYKAVTGLTSITPASTPFAADESNDVYLRRLSKPGRRAKSCASFLMKLLWAARQAVPQLSYTIHSLASQMHKWSEEADRRLHRLYQYVTHVVSQDWVLSGSLSTLDLERLELRGWPDADLAGDNWTTKSTSGCFIELA